MEKLNEFLKKNVVEIAFGMAGVGLLTHIILALTKYSKIVGLFSIIHLRDPLRFFMRNFHDFHNLRFLSFLFLIMLGVGGWHYKKSNGQDSRLLKFGFSIISIKTIFLILTTPISYLGFKKTIATASNFNGTPPTAFDFIYPLFILIPLAYISFYLTKWLIQQSMLDYKTEETDYGKIIYSFDGIPRWTRFGHFVFDLFLMTMIVWPFITMIIAFTSKRIFAQSFSSWTNNSFAFSFVIALTIIIYYLIFEGIFNATPIKFLTGTRVVDEENMENPGFAKILGRSLCRRIPFESFSFFGKKGWHDSLSGTAVIYEKKEGLVKFKQKNWIFILLGTYLSLIAFSYLNEMIDDSRRDKMYKSHSEYQNKSVLENLNKGDLLLFRKDKGKYDDKQAAVVISKISDQEITGIQYLINPRKKTDRRNYTTKGITGDWEMEGQVSINETLLSKALINKSDRTIINLGDTPYLLTAIEDMDNPYFKSSGSSMRSRDGVRTRSHRVSYDVSKVEILSLESLEGKVNWVTDLPLKTTFNSEWSTGNFELKVEEKNNKITKSRMKVRHKGREISYIIFKQDSNLSFAKEIRE